MTMAHSNGETRTIQALREEIARIQANPHGLSPAALAKALVAAERTLSRYEQSHEEQ